MSDWWQQELEGAGEDWWNTVSRVHEDWWTLEGGEPGDWWQNFESQGVEEGEWVTGVSKSLPIEWYMIDAYVPVDPNREIIQITFEPQTLNHNDGGHFDLFSIARSLMMDKLYGNEEEMKALEAVASGDLPKTIPIFAAPQDRTIEAVWILPEGDTTATGDDRVTLTLYNETASGAICTATIWDEGDDQLQAYQLRQFGGVSDTFGQLPAGTGVSLRITHEAGDPFNIPRSIIIIQWDIADFGEG